MIQEQIWKGNGNKSFLSSHASTLETMQDGRAIIAYFAGTRERHPDTHIQVVIRNSPMNYEGVRNFKVSNEPHWNPVLYRMDDTIYLWFKVGPSPVHWVTWVTSTTDGINWTTPKSLKANLGPVKNKPILMSNGVMIAPNSVETVHSWLAEMDISTNIDEQNWKPTKAPFQPDGMKIGVIQPTVWESLEGHIHIMLRSLNGWIYRADSYDFGATWGQMYPINVRNNNSGIDVVNAYNALWLVCNPVAYKGRGTPRTPLSLMVNRQNGHLGWDTVEYLETKEGEYSYPAIIQTPTGLAGTYTWNRKDIVYWEIDREEIC